MNLALELNFTIKFLVNTLDFKSQEYWDLASERSKRKKANKQKTFNLEFHLRWSIVFTRKLHNNVSKNPTFFFFFTLKKLVTAHANNWMWLRYYVEMQSFLCVVNNYIFCLFSFFSEYLSGKIMDAYRGYNINFGYTPWLSMQGHRSQSGTLSIGRVWLKPFQKGTLPQSPVQELILSLFSPWFITSDCSHVLFYISAYLRIYNKHYKVRYLMSFRKWPSLSNIITENSMYIWILKKMSYHDEILMNSLEGERNYF